MGNFEMKAFVFVIPSTKETKTARGCDIGACRVVSWCPRLNKLYRSEMARFVFFLNIFTSDNLKYRRLKFENF